MFIDGLENIFVDAERIAFAQVGNPEALQFVLQVGNDLDTYVGIVLGLLQQLAVDGVNGVSLHAVYLDILNLEHLAVDKLVIAFLEQSFLHADADDGVAIEGLAQGFVPVGKLQFLHALGDRFDIGLVLHVVNHTLVTGIVFPLVLIAFLVLFEIVSQALLVL